MHLIKPLRPNSFRILITTLALLLGAILNAAHAAPQKSEHIYRFNPNISLDIYHTPASTPAPVLVYVHGGAWVRGKRSAVQSKPAHFTAKGYVFVSLDYRLVPQTTVSGQLQDIDLALAWLHKNIAAFGGDPANIHLMGHSAGAHLVSMTAIAPLKNARALLASGAIRSVISNDTRAYDIPRVAKESRSGTLPKLYLNAFGTDQKYWQQMSPITHIKPAQKYPAFLLLYSGQGRAAVRASFAADFKRQLKRGGTSVEIFNGQQFNHREINIMIGQNPNLTRTIDRFLARHH